MVTSVFVTKVIKIQRIMNTRVTVVDGVPAACRCPADAVYDGVCKHRVAVAIRPQILDIARRRQAITDSGVVTDGSDKDQSDTGDTTQCDCDGLSNDFPCWECYCGQVVETSSVAPNRHTPLCPRLFISPGVRGVDNTPLTNYRWQLEISTKRASTGTSRQTQHKPMSGCDGRVTTNAIKETIWGLWTRY